MDKFLLVFLAFAVQIFGLDVKRCSISDEIKHAGNQKILSAVLTEELKPVQKRTAQEQAEYLTSRISEIAEKILKKGFAIDAYSNPKADVDSILAFDCFSLWEGESHDAIPLTFLVYVWPSEEYALQYNASHPRNRYYSSNIHSHPISCALAVLEGTMVQKNFELMAVHSVDRIVRQIGEETFQKGDGTVDDLSEPFIHQLYAKGNGAKPAISLHVYGLPSEEKVMASFQETSKSHSYSRIMEKDGVVKNVLPLNRFNPEPIF